MASDSPMRMWENYVPCVLCAGEWLRRDLVDRGSVEEACGAHDEEELGKFRAKREKELATARQQKKAEKQKELAKQPARRGLQKKPAAKSRRGERHSLQKKPAGRGLQKKPAAKRGVR